MIFQSPYGPVPDIPTVNYYTWLLERPDVAQWPDYVAYVDGPTGRARRLREFLARVESLAAALAAPASKGGLDLRGDAGEMVGILSENNIEWPTLAFALLKIAVPIALFPASSTDGEVTALAKLSKMTHLFVSPKLLPQALVVATAIQLPYDRIYIIQGHVPGRRSLDDFVAQARTDDLKIATRPVRVNTIAYLMFSSGTSGLPKGIISSHQNLCYQSVQPVVMIKEIEKVYTPPPLNTPEGIPVGIGYAPLYHVMGFHLNIIRHFLQPQTVVMIPKWDTELMFTLIAKYKVSFLSLVPAHVHMLTHSPSFKDADLSGLVQIGGGAAYLPDDLRQKFVSRIRNAKWWIETFGMSETTGASLMAACPGTFGDRYKQVAGSLGILVPGFEGRIVREDGTDADIGEPGELWLRGKANALGYYNNDKATRETFLPDGWMRTGDRFSVDEVGRFYYIERVKDTLKISGVQVSPSEIEDALLEHAGGLIVDVAVAGVPGTRMVDEKVPRAWVVLSDLGRQKGEKAVIEILEVWIKERLSKQKWLRGGIQVIDEIPKSPTGKVLRRKLIEQTASPGGGEGALRAKL
ncbi:acetyl-CoA synthetase-like protein [Amylostereum chailletii]|nr:acetyl-CoA synthetase-like protein [Amylostereum chailletii]